LKAIKLKNEFLDSTSIVNNRNLLSDILGNNMQNFNGQTFDFSTVPTTMATITINRTGRYLLLNRIYLSGAVAGRLAIGTLIRNNSIEIDNTAQTLNNGIESFLLFTVINLNAGDTIQSRLVLDSGVASMWSTSRLNAIQLS